MKLYRYRQFNNQNFIYYDPDSEQYIETKRWIAEVMYGMVIPTCPNKFNDPFDTMTVMNGTSLKNALEYGRLNMFIDCINRNLLKFKKNQLTELEIKEIKSSKNFEKTIKNILRKRDSYFNFEKFYSIEESFKDRLKMICFSKVNDSVLMWSHYTNCNSGYCIEYDFPETSDEYKLIYKVNYKNSFPETYKIIEPSVSDLVELATTKSDIWSYEQEYRYIIKNNDFVRKTENNVQTYIFGNTLKILNWQKYIKSIYIGCNANEDDEVLAAIIAKIKGYKAYKMIAQENNYVLEPKEINLDELNFDLLS